jgi:Flp pilus assembly pilin Flp
MFFSRFKGRISFSERGASSAEYTLLCSILCLALTTTIGNFHSAAENKFSALRLTGLRPSAVSQPPESGGGSTTTQETKDWRPLYTSPDPNDQINGANPPNRPEEAISGDAPQSPGLTDSHAASSNETP